MEVEYQDIESKVTNGGLNKLYIYESSTKNAAINSFSKENDYEDCNDVELPEKKIFTFNKTCILFDDDLRKFIASSSTIFLNSRSFDNNQPIKQYLLELSREHRSVLRECMENFDNLKTNTSESNKYVQWKEMFKNIETIWHLSELFYLDYSSDLQKFSNSPVLPKLIQWTHVHSSKEEWEQQISNIISTASKSIPGSSIGATFRAEIQNDQYWNIIFWLLIQSRFGEIRTLLQLHSKGDTDIFRQAQMFISNYPVFTNNYETEDYLIEWRKWKRLVHSNLNVSIFKAVPELHLLVRVLNGEKIALKELKQQFKWYQLMVADIMFLEPATKFSDLSRHAKYSCQQYGQVKNMKLLDETILAVAAADFPQLVNKLLLTADDGWCVSHLFNLLLLGGCLKKDDRNWSLIVENLIQDFGLLLMTDKSLWQLGVTYLEQCKSVGKSCLRNVLPTLKLNNINTAKRIVQIAKQNHLHEIASTVSRVISRRYLDRKSLGNAMTWAIKSADPEYVTDLCEVYLRTYTSESNVYLEDALMHLGEAAFISPTLAFLSKYCEFHHLYYEQKYKEAGTLLIKLIGSKTAPKYFWKTLLQDSENFFELEPSVFSSNDALVISRCFEELTYKNEDKFPNFLDKLSNYLTSKILPIECSAIDQDEENVIVCH